MRTDRKTRNVVSPDYVERVNRAIDHIVRNLGQPLRLEEVAEAACFSPFHFHRVFKALRGETLNEFVKRQRLERALYLMSHSPQRSLTDVALDCGFSSSSDFSRSFKQRYGQAPSAFDLETFRSARREEFERALSNQNGSPRFKALPAGENPDGFEVTLRDLPARTVAYIRVLDPYREGVPQAVRTTLRLGDRARARGRPAARLHVGGARDRRPRRLPIRRRARGRRRRARR